LWLTQSRDAQLGPSTRKSSNIPEHCFLAEIIKPGTAMSPGIIQLGKTELRKASCLKKKIENLDRHRPTNEHKLPLTYKDKNGDEWKVKLSGLPVGHKDKKEGLFKGNGKKLELSEKFWSDYSGRHRHSVHSELKEGELIWLEPMHPDCKNITCEADIKSIQWSRWGRHGKAFKNLINSLKIFPDSLRRDGGVDMVTDLFGQIPAKGIPAAGPFSARIRPGNLIFFDAKGQTTIETLAPLLAPHPGCIAFYRDQEDLDLIDTNSPLKGYKVYRNTKERGDNAPWKYSVQGIYGEKGALKKPYRQKVNKTAELLNEGLIGRLRISFRALDSDELALLYAACSVDWKLGGGKPLGLGHCRVVSMKMIDEEGVDSFPMENSSTGDNLRLSKVDMERVEHIRKRIDLYKASQVPVSKLRYPRAVRKNRNTSRRAGHEWFVRHAAPRKKGKGLETIWTTGELEKTVQNSQIKAQALPALNAEDPSADSLYGYDIVGLEIESSKGTQRKIDKLVKFDPAIHAAENEKPGINVSQNQGSRALARSGRTYDEIITDGSLETSKKINKKKNKQQKSKKT